MIDQRTSHWPALGSPLQLDETLKCFFIVELPYPCSAMTCCASADYCCCSSRKTCVGFIVGQHVEAMVRAIISTVRGVVVRRRNVAAKRTPTSCSGLCCFSPPPYAIIMKPMATMELHQHRLRLVHSVLTNQTDQLRTTQLSIEDKTIEDNTIV